MAMVRFALSIGLAAGAVGLAGCGTFLNMQDEPFRLFWPDPATPTRRVYGGVAYDAAVGTDILVGSFRPDGDFFGPIGFNWASYVLTVDLPLCVIGDTLTLPWTVPASAERALGVSAGPDPSRYQLAPGVQAPSADAR
jgi:uncharacterized protein YceK